MQLKIKTPTGYAHTVKISCITGAFKKKMLAKLDNAFKRPST